MDTLKASIAKATVTLVKHLDSAKEDISGSRFRSHVLIAEPSEWDSEVVHQFSVPVDYRFDTAEEAEAFGMVWAIQWMDQQIASKQVKD